MNRLFFIFLLAIILLTGCSSDSSFQGAGQDSDIVNILVIGADMKDNTDSRADTIMIAQYNPKAGKVKLVSIMRDSYVDIPGSNHMFQKINNAYSTGKAELLRQTIKDNFDIDVQHFVSLDFAGFVKVVDLVAPNGVQVNITPEIIKDMGLTLQPGIQKVHGQELLAYARFRHDDEYDFGRVKRQQEVTMALKDEFMRTLESPDILSKIPVIRDVLSNDVNTDMNLKDMVTLGGTVLFSKVTSMETLRIPVDTSYKNASHEGSGTVLELDFPKNKAALKTFLTEENAR